MDLLDILKLAVGEEMVRKAAYEEAAAKATNPLVKSTFTALAQDEEKHAQAVQAYYDRHVAENGWPAPSEMGIDDDFREVIKEIFKQANCVIKSTGESPQAELHDAYEAGILAELESVHFYTDAMNHATNPHAKAFLAALVETETLHHRLLKQTQKYLDNPADWYFEEEQWIVTG